jgi:hypothetical protein
LKSRFCRAFNELELFVVCHSLISNNIIKESTLKFIINLLALLFP